MASILSDDTSTRSHPLYSVLGVLNCCALDAPAVAIAWQLALWPSSAGPTKSSSWIALSLGLTVWLIYVADRLLDGCRVDTTRSVTARHVFSQRFATPLSVTWLCVLAIDLALLTVLPISVIRHELLLVPLLALYLLLIHTPSPIARKFPKELCVGPIFAAGIVLSQVEFEPTVATFCIFGTLTILFVANCLIVSYAQRDADVEQGMSNGWELVRYTTHAMHHFCWLTPMSVAVFCLAGLLDIYQSLALGTSACLLTILWQRIRRASDVEEQLALSLLADYALSVPAIVLFVTTFWQ